MRALAALAVVLGLACGIARAEEPFRPPAVPLVTHHPYFSAYLMADRPTDDWPRHWTGAVNALCGMVRIDGKPYRVLGPAPKEIPPMDFLGLELSPTSTAFHFQAGGVDLDLCFTSPLLPRDIEVLTRPVTYLEWKALSRDGRNHDVSLYLDATAEWAVNTPDQLVAWERVQAEGLEVMKIGSAEQPILGRAGDNVRIDWGHFYLAAPKGPTVRCAILSDTLARDAFSRGEALPNADDPRLPRPAQDQWPVLAVVMGLGQVGPEPVQRHALLAYDEIYAMEYLGQRLRPYWRRDGREPEALLKAAETERANILQRCRAFDEAFVRDLDRVGGKEYASMCTLAYRQAMAAHGTAAGPDGSLLMLSKENFSNGCAGTVDVFYPASPLFLLVNPELIKAQMRPVLDYATSDRWKFPFAPHDLGKYPLANGQVYGGGEKTEENQMPVEESGNLLILAAAVAEVEGNAEFARAYWPLLSLWADYLKAKGLDPENQLCTDDFAGHLAHNTNLSLKAIVALKCYAELAAKLGEPEKAAALSDTVKEMVARWMEMAQDGDHYRLAFDRPDTWSQKYNLAWQRVLKLDLFPPDVARREIAYYLQKQNTYGLPLDNRSQYTKLDWIFWTATLAENRRDFQALVEPTYRFAQDTPDRVPLTDWYWTTDAKKRGFQARSVVGGLFMTMLADHDAWKRWSSGEVPR